MRCQVPGGRAEVYQWRHVDAGWIYGLSGDVAAAEPTGAGSVRIQVCYHDEAFTLLGCSHELATPGYRARLHLDSLAPRRAVLARVALRVAGDTGGGYVHFDSAGFRAPLHPSEVPAVADLVIP